jgi:hypothetical protein
MDDKVLKGVYANAMGISHSKEEFVLDFLNIYPWQRAGVVTSRVITSPGHIKRIFKALEENIKKYEKKFGRIEEAKAPSSEEIGFKA